MSDFEFPDFSTPDPFSSPPSARDEEGRLRRITRRTLFKELGYGIGGMALANLLAEQAAANPQTRNPAKPQYQDPLAPKPPHFKPKAKNIIYMFMAGAPRNPATNTFAGLVSNSSAVPTCCNLP